MNVKCTLALFAMAMLLLQHSHCIPTHRNAREARGDIFNKIKEYMGQYQSGGSNAPTSSGASSEATSGSSGSQQGQGETYTQPETSAGTEHAASEPEPSVVAKDSSSSSSSSASGFSNPFNSYIPEQYQNQFNPNKFNPSQYGQFPTQFGQYMPSNSANPSPTPATAASEQDFTVAAKDSSSSSSSSAGGFSNPFNSYIPEQYQNQFNPNKFNPSQYGQFPTQFGQYMPSNSANPSPTPATAASEQDFTVAAKDSSSSSSSSTGGFSNPFNSYIPEQYQNQFNPNKFNPSQYGQFPTQFGQYMPSNSANPSPTPATAASEQDFTVAARDSSSSSSSSTGGFSNPFNSYIPAQYQNQFSPTQFNPSQCGQFPTQFGQYMPSNSANPSPTPATAASEQDFTVAARDSSSSSSSSTGGFSNPFNSYIPAQYQNQFSPTQFNPSQCGQFPTQFGQYMPSNSANPSPTPATAASEQDFTVAARDSSSSSSSSTGGFSNPFNSYIPAQYQNQFSPTQFSQCSGQFGQYIPTNGAGSSSSPHSPGAASATPNSP